MNTRYPNFSRNLRIACDQYSSVAEVCRSLEINRQQFNKYLSGQIHPSRHNLKRICEFFKINEKQFDLNAIEFKACIAKTGKEATNTTGNPVEQVIDSLPNSIDELARYEGYYYSHFHALGYPGSVIRSLIHVYRSGERFYTTSIEHLWNKEKKHTRHHRFKYNGVVLYLADRIFITEYETLAKKTVCQTILFPNYRYALDTLSGITTGVGSLHSHPPKSTRIEWQFLGREIDLREAINGCALYDSDSKAISLEIRERIDNTFSPNEHMLTARDQ